MDFAKCWTPPNYRLSRKLGFTDLWTSPNRRLYCIEDFAELWFSRIMNLPSYDFADLWIFPVMAFPNQDHFGLWLHLILISSNYDFAELLTLRLYALISFCYLYCKHRPKITPHYIIHHVSRNFVPCYEEKLKIKTIKNELKSYMQRGGQTGKIIIDAIYNKNKSKL